MPNNPQPHLPEITVVPFDWDEYDFLLDEDFDDDLLPSDVEYPDDDEESGDVVW